MTADLKVFAAHSLFGTSCITSLTVQSTMGVLSSHPTPADIVAATLECLDADLPPAGIKIGMVSSTDNTLVISSYVEKLHKQHSLGSRAKIPVVLDTVLRSSSGRDLLDPAALNTLQDRLLPLVDWITPNLDELAVLTNTKTLGRNDLLSASHNLQDEIAQKPNGHRIGIIATGGHLDPPDDLILLPSGESAWLPGERIVSNSTHGTGCAFSSAFLCRLVLGDAPQQAALSAKNYASKAIRSAQQIGHGHSPINHLWPILDL